MSTRLAVAALLVVACVLGHVIDRNAPLWVTVGYAAVGFVSDRLVAKRLGWWPERYRDWFFFGAAHWAWPVTLTGLGVLWLWMVHAEKREARS